MQHAGGEDDKDPGVDDGVNRDEAEGSQVMAVILKLPYRVDVDPDLRWMGRGSKRNRELN